MDQSLRWLAADETKHSCEVRMTEDGWSLEKSKGIKKKSHQLKIINPGVLFAYSEVWVTQTAKAAKAIIRLFSLEL